MNTKFDEMAKEYEQSIELLSGCIPDIRAQRKKAALEGDKDRFRLLSKKLAVVYEEIRDMRIVAETLRHYYDDCDNEEQLTEAC
ncbi:MAG: hypothetical protein IJZ35_04990 [Clostridia bacterium]|nr:hypothetical protein [Clostridia bacterium]